MGLLKRIFAPKEVRIALNVLDELSFELDSVAFKEMRSQIKKGIFSDYKNIVSQVKDRESARQLIYFAIVNIAGEYIESGYYHIYRGVLNPLGDDFLSLFDMSVKRLLEVGAITAKEAEEQTQKASGQQLQTCMDMADFVVTNEGNLEEFYKKLEKFL